MGTTCMRTARLVTIAALAAMTCAVASVPASSVGAASGTSSGTDRAKQLVIGSLAPETGEFAPVLESLREPVKMAIREINAAGGVGRGRTARLVTADEGIESQSVVGATERLIDTEHAHAIMGPSTSTSALAILDTVKDSALVCSGSNTSAQLTTAGPERSGGLYFRTSPPDRLQGPALAELVLSDGHSNIGLVSPTDSSSKPFASSVARALEEGGAEVTHASFDPSSETPAVAVQRVLRKKPDAIVVTAREVAGPQVIKALIDHGSGPSALPVYANDGLFDPGFPKQVDAANPGVVAGLRGTAPAADPGGTDTAFDKSFAAKNIDPFFSSYYYDCTILTALAAVKAKSDDPKKMAKAFPENLKGANDCRSFAECKQLLGQGKTIHYRGASSRFDEWDTSEPNEGTYDVWEYDRSGTGELKGPDSQITIR
jgi:branched-chain amino acid transport system substrate-binding protein